MFVGRCIGRYIGPGDQTGRPYIYNQNKTKHYLHYIPQS